MGVISRLLTTVALVASAIVAIGFVAFAVDELGGASKHQQNEVVNADATQPQARASRHSGARRTLDDASNALLKPFKDVVQSSDSWVRRGVPTVLALLLYGLGLGFLARSLRQRA